MDPVTPPGPTPVPLPAGPPPAGQPRIVAATLAVLAGSAVALVSSLAIRVALARLLEPSAVGVLLLALGVVSALGGLASLGVNQAIARHVAALLATGGRRWALRAARGTALMTGTSGAVAAAALLAAAPVLGSWLAPEADAAALATALRALSPVVLALALGLTGLGVNRGYGGVRSRVLLRDAGGGVLRAAAVTVAALVSRDLVAVCLAFAAALLVTEGSFLAHALRRLQRGREEPIERSELAAGRETSGAADGATGGAPLRLAELVPFTLMELLNQAQQWFDLLLLGLFVAPAEVALYGLARALTRSMDLARAAAAHRFLPAATRAASLPGAAGRQRFADVYLGTRLLVMVLLWLPMLAALTLPGVLMRLLFGAAYAAAGPLLALLALGVLLESLFGFKDQSLVALGRERELVWLRAVAQGVGAAALLVLAPRFGATGAALAVLAMQAVRSAGLTVLLARGGGMPTLRREFPAALWGALALAGAAWLAARGLAPWPALAVVAAGGGGGVLLLLRSALRRHGAGTGGGGGGGGTGRWRRLLGA